MCTILAFALGSFLGGSFGIVMAAVLMEDKEGGNGMTGVLIKNWCIPECCMDCDPDFAYAINCKAYNENNDFTRQRAENCPLVEIKHSQDGDTIYRADAIEAVRKVVIDNDVVDALNALPSAEAKGANLINRHDATTVIREECWKCNNLINADLLGRILALPTSRQTDCTEFVEWLIEIILDDEDWELNAVGYGEIIARKMAKLGLLEVLDGYYIRTPNKPQSVVAEIKIDTDEIVSKAISELSAEAEWIPCSERLPKAEDMYQPPEQRYLCQLEAYGVRKFCVLSRLKGAVSPFWDWYGVAIHDSEVTAWMPLPKPYREEREVEE